jgi:hypothetical protein
MASEIDLDSVDAHELGERLGRMRSRFDEFRGRL